MKSDQNLKSVLASEVKKLCSSVVPIRRGFLDLDNVSPFKFLDLNNFLIFNNFPHFSINLSPPSMPPTSFAASTSSATSTYDNTVVFSIDVSDAAILLKL